MWNSLSPAWQGSLEEAWAAYCAGTVPIGSVITDAGGIILSRGRNHIFEQRPDSSQTLYGHRLAHAEINALIGLDFQSISPQACILYSTCEPCPLCIGAFYVSGLRQLHYACQDAYGGSVNLLWTTAYMRRRPVRVYGPENPLLETMIMAIQVDFELRSKDQERTSILLSEWRSSVPQGVALGQILHKTGLLSQIRESGVEAGEMIDTLCSLTGNSPQE